MPMQQGYGSTGGREGFSLDQIPQIIEMYLQNQPRTKGRNNGENDPEYQAFLQNGSTLDNQPQTSRHQQHADQLAGLDQELSQARAFSNRPRERNIGEQVGVPLLGALQNLFGKMDSRRGSTAQGRQDALNTFGLSNRLDQSDFLAKQQQFQNTYGDINARRSAAGLDYQVANREEADRRYQEGIDYRDRPKPVVPAKAQEANNIQELYTIYLQRQVQTGEPIPPNVQQAYDLSIAKGESGSSLNLGTGANFLKSSHAATEQKILGQADRYARGLPEEFGLTNTDDPSKSILPINERRFLSQGADITSQPVTNTFGSDIPADPLDSLGIFNQQALANDSTLDASLRKLGGNYGFGGSQRTDPRLGFGASTSDNSTTNLNSVMSSRGTLVPNNADFKPAAEQLAPDLEQYGKQEFYDWEEMSFEQRIELLRLDGKL